MPDALARFFQSARVRVALSVVQKLVGLAALFVIVRELSHIGWRELWAGLPSSPAFYAVFMAIYFLGPGIDALIYGRLWGTSPLCNLPVLLRKRIFNEIVVDYAGEAYLYIWAKRNLALDGRKLASTIKDVNLLSGAASNVVTLVLIAGFIAGGYGAMLASIDPDVMHAVMAVAALAITVPLLLFVFRGRLLAVSRGALVAIMSAHISRILLVLALQVVQWSAALPQVPAAQWMLFLTAQMLVTRLPLLPNRDIVLMGLGVALAPLISAPQNHVASMFVAAGALSLITHAVIFVVTAARPPVQPEPQPA